MKKLIKAACILCAVLFAFQFVIPGPVPSVLAADDQIVPGLLISSDETLVDGTDYDWDETNHVFTIQSNKPITLSNVDPDEAVNVQIRIPENIPAQLTLAGVNIYTLQDSISASKDCILMEESTADVNITLADGTKNQLGVQYGIAIHKEGGQDSGMLTLDGDGYLIASSNDFKSPVIGTIGKAGDPKEASNITILGGHYQLENTNGGDYTAAIGGGYNASASNIHIKGGTFTITGFKNSIGGGTNPYSKPCGSSNIVVSQNASVSLERQENPLFLEGTGNIAYCMVIENPEGETVYVDGHRHPLAEHRAEPDTAEQELYVYLDAGSSADLHEIRVGDNVSYYYYDTDQRCWISPTVPAQEQIRFEEDALTLVYEEGLTYKNTLINPNEGSTVVYSIDKPEIASIDDNGLVTIEKSGTVVIHALSKKDGCEDTSAYYTLSIKESHEIKIQATGGTVTADVDNAIAGKEVKLTLVPDGGNQLYSLQVLTESGKKVAYNSTTNSFFMPEENVTVTVEFVTAIYDIKLNQGTHGVTKAPSSAAPGKKVSLQVSFDTGYELDEILVVQTSDGTKVSFDKDTLSFLMPESNVEITPSFKKTTYKINLTTPESGAISSDKATAAWGEKVTLTITIPEDSEINSVTVVDSEDKNIALTQEDGKTYSFVMPMDYVTASVAFDRLPHKILLNTGAHGTVTANLTEARPGTEVLLTISPEHDYSLSEIKTVPETEVQKIDATTYRFLMPKTGTDVTVVSTFIYNPEGTKTNPWLVGENDPADVKAWFDPTSKALYFSTDKANVRMKDFAVGERPWESVAPQVNNISVNSMGIKNIGAGAFAGCTGLTDISIPDSVTEIGDKAFSNCSNLPEVTIPTDIESIGERCFENCKNLKKITYKGKRPVIASDAFQNDLADVYINYDFFDFYTFDEVQINDPNGTYYFGAKQLTYIVNAGGKAPWRHMVYVDQTMGGKVYLTYVPAAEGTTCYIMLESWGNIPRGVIIQSEPNITFNRESYIEQLYSNRSKYSFRMPDRDVTIKVAFVTNPGGDPPTPENPENPNGTPDTGDDNNKALWLGILFASMALLGAAIIAKKKHSNQR